MPRSSAEGRASKHAAAELPFEGRASRGLHRVTSYSERMVQFVAAGATVASGWLLRLSASATKPEAFISSTNVFR